MGTRGLRRSIRCIIIDVTGVHGQSLALLLNHMLRLTQMVRPTGFRFRVYA